MEGNKEGFLILIILIVIVVFMSRDKDDSRPNTLNNSSPSKTVIEESESSKPASSYSEEISISRGNASQEYQPYKEYITLRNRGSEPVDITNWQLRNGKNKRAYDMGGTLRYFPADTAFIPKAVLFISPTSNSALQNVILNPGETAIVTTGKMGSELPYKIISFKENICSGYLEDMSEYTFTPRLSSNCPDPEEEIGVTALDTECRKFIERMSSCRTPEFETRDRDGEICYNCVNGTQLSSACVTFIRSHFSYAGCIANHRNDPDFSGRTWRIFLGKGWEMWAREYESIELFDLVGRSVSNITY